MHLNNLGWWLIILLNLIGYSVFRFGSSKNGRLSPVVEFMGGTILIASFILMGLIFGIKEVLILIIIFMLPITLLNELFLYKGKLVKRQDDSAQGDLKMLEELMPGITKEENKDKGSERDKIIANKNIPDVIKQELIKRDEK